MKYTYNNRTILHTLAKNLNEITFNSYLSGLDITLAFTFTITLTFVELLPTLSLFFPLLFDLQFVIDTSCFVLLFNQVSACVFG